MGTVLITYIFSYLLQILFPLAINYAQAETPIDNIHLVAVIVDKKLYDDSTVKTDIQRYAQQYIQQEMGASKALVLPVDTTQITAPEIVKMLENLYFEGQKDVTSTLDGLVLIGDDVPLPVINDEWYIFPTIFPYVDFIDQRFLYSKDSGYFEPNDEEMSEPELWHGAIFLWDNTQSYIDYFAKLRSYQDNPEWYIAKKIWYDDFRAYAETLNPDFIWYYVNKFLFAEDVNYKRYSSLLFDLFNADHNENVDEIFNTPVQYESWSFYADSAAEFNDIMAGQPAAPDQPQDIPTKLLESTLVNFFKWYSELLWNKYLRSLRDNVLAWGRYTVEDIDTHSDFMEIQDSLYLSSKSENSILLQYNETLKKALVAEVKKNEYAMNIPLLVFYREDANQIWNTQDNLNCWKDWFYLVGEYENYYHGKNAWDIVKAEDLSIYRWTYQNFSSLSEVQAYDYSQSGALPELLTKPVGWSYSILNQQIEANRGYDFFLAKRDVDDQQVQEDNKATTACDTKELYVEWYRGWNTPLNLWTWLQGELALNFSRFDLAWNPSFDRTIWGWLYDIVGARKTVVPHDEANSWKAVEAFSSIQKIQRQDAWTIFVPNNPVTIVAALLALQPPLPVERAQKACDITGRTTKPYSELDYFSIMSWLQLVQGIDQSVEIVTGTKSTTVNPIVLASYSQSQACDVVNRFGVVVNGATVWGIDVWGWFKKKQKFQYKTLDSTVINDSPDTWEFNNMNQFTTLSSPIDSSPNMTFQWLHGKTINLQFPSLYQVPIYTNNSGTLTLMTQTGIMDSIDAYLRKSVVDYNQQLLQALTQRSMNYIDHQRAYDLLGDADPLATPNRGYQLLDPDFFVDLMPQDLKKQFADILRLQSSPWKSRLANTDALADIKEIKNTADINVKIKSVIWTYIQQNDAPDAISMRWYNTWGYEVAYINSDWNDYLTYDTVPVILDRIVGQQNSMSLLADDATEQDIGDDQLECGIDADWTVPLFWRSDEYNWFQSLECWLQRTIASPLKLEVTFKDAQWPVLVLDQFKDIINDFSKPILSWTHETIETYPQQRLESLENQIANDAIINSTTWTNGPNMQDVLTQIQPSTSSSVFFLEPVAGQIQTPFVRIKATKDLWEITRRISTTWDNCLAIQWQDICNSPFELLLNPYTDEQLLNVRLTKTKAWVMNIKHELCIDTSCVTKSDRVFVAPGNVANISIDYPYNKILAWAEMPILLTATDQYGNAVGEQIDRFQLTVSNWKINGRSQPQEFTNFGKATFLYESDQNSSPGNIEITVNSVTNPSLVSATSRFERVNWTLTISSWSSAISAVNYKLPDTYNAIRYITVWWLQDINTWAVPSIQLDLKASDWSPLTAVAGLQVKNGIIKPGRFENEYKEVLLAWQTTQVLHRVFKQENTISIIDGKASVVIFPQMKTWEDELIITIPWIDPFVLPITIEPGNARIVTAKNKSDSLYIWQTADVSFTVTDLRENKIPWITPLDIRALGPISYTWASTVNAIDGKLDVSIQTLDPGGRGFLTALIAGVGFNQQSPGFASFNVQNSFIPTDNLNIMYMNLFGSDRANLWWYFSQNDSIGSQMINNSPKMLALTTQLIDPSKIYQFIATVKSNGYITTDNSENIILTLDQNQLFAEHIQGEYSLAMWQFSDYSLEQRQTREGIPASVQSPTLFYIPFIPDASITQNIVQSNSVILNWSPIISAQWIDVDITLSSEKYQNSNVWIVKSNGVKIGELVLLRNDNAIITNMSQTITSASNDVTIMFGDWSTNWAQSLWIYSLATSAEAQWYESIESSLDYARNVGFRHPFQNISAFAGWNTVGESTKWFASPLLINLWDPLLKRVTKNTQKNDTDFDTGIGQVIHTDASSPILKVVDWDINNDGLSDLLTVYQDWRVQRNKNYGWDNPFTDLKDLLHIDERIKDVWLWDVDGNDYKDIIVRTTKDKVRVYKNTNTVFGVDGFPVCLDHGGEPDSLASVEQFFLEDMDLDGALDIVVNTHLGEVKIIYGWSSASGDNYISNELLGCDNQRRDRQQDSIKLVKQYGSELRSELKIVDNSLIRREGLSAQDEFDQIENPDIAASLPLPASDPTIGIDFSTFDPAAIVNDAAEWVLRWTISPVPFVPVYETLTEEDIRYIAMNQIDPTDEVDIYKTYKDLNGDLLQSWDIVEITVTIEWPTSKKLTYFDLLKWPRTVDVAADWTLLTFNSWTLNSDATRTALPDSEYLFLLDNIDLEGNAKTTFSYTVEYSGWPLVRIDVEKVSDDEYPDIKAFPLDGCMQYRRDCINTNDSNEAFREYEEEEKNLWDAMDDFVDNQWNTTENHVWDLTNSVQDVVSNQSVEWLSEITWIGGERDFQSAFDDFLTNEWQVNLWNIDLNLFESELDTINGAIDDVLKWLCQWFSIENAACQWLPVPFNMSLLTPGEYNIFGCKPKFPTINRIFPDDKWFPAFWFPWTQQIWPYRVPFPWWSQMLSNVDDFGYWYPSQGWNYPSAVRIYVSPTLTLWVGVAICVWPQAWFNNIPSPFQDIAWNCVVLALPAPTVCGAWEWDEGIDWDLYDALDKNACATPPITPALPGDKSSSPRALVAKDPVDGSTRPPVADGTYFGILQFESSPNLRQADDTNDGVQLNAAEQLNTQIQWWMQAVKGLVKCLINDWMDKQVRYILNNLTNLTIWLYLPDLRDLGQWFDQLNTTNFNNKMDALEDSQADVNRNADYKSDSILWNAWADVMRSSWLQKWDLRKLSDWASNPFDAISEMFNNIPLVNINTRDINIVVPMIYSEDIRAYTTYLNSYLEESRSTLQEREWLLQWVMWVCWQELSVDQIKRWISKAEASGLTWEDLSAQVKKLQNQVVDKNTNMKNEAARLSSCTKDIEAGNDPAQCPWESEADIRQGYENLSSYAGVNNECMSFLFGKNTNWDINTSSVNTNLSNFIQFETNTSQVMYQIRQNLRVLERYRQFPFELYERVHVRDRYLSELSATINSFLWSLTHWLQLNARRFEKYVDVIITLIWVVKTFQAIIDLSVNRSEQCSKCTNDNYDNYACKLSIICVDLPILPIPPFKIPSIFLDFSHLDLGIDILLPEFQFVPTNIPLPDLPKLPKPPQVNIDIDLDLQGNFELQLFADLILGLNWWLNLWSLSIPNIPILPEPPILPPLPSFLPTLELELPVLPPAPRIPRLMPEIKTVLDITDAAGKIYCIIKWWVGLVGEQWVKTKIEQLTQRTWDVPFFDDMNITSFSKETPLQWFDWKVDAYLQFNYNFTYVYDLLKWFADIANDNINQYVIAPTNEWINQFNNLSTQAENEYMPIFQQNIDLNLNIPINVWATWGNQTWAFNWNSITKDIAVHTSGSLLHQEEDDYEIAYAELINGLKLLRDSKFAQTAPYDTKKLMTDTLDVLAINPNVTANTEGIDSISHSVNAIFDQQHEDMLVMKDQIKNDYDEFLNDLWSKTQLVSKDKLTQTFETNLFNVDERIKKTIEDQEHPMRTYLNMQSAEMSWYENALKNNTPAQLNMTAEKHDKIRGQVRYLKTWIETMLSVLDWEVESLDDLQSRLSYAQQQQTYQTPVLKRKSTEYAVHSLMCEETSKDVSKVGTWFITSAMNKTKTSATWFAGLSYIPAYQNAFKSDIPKYTQLWNTPAPSSSQDNIMKYIDFKQYLEWIYIRTGNDIVGHRHVKVVSSAYHGKQIAKNYLQVDINKSWKEDIIMRDKNTIYMKYADQDDIIGDDQLVDYFNGLYDTATIQSMDNLKARTQNSEWYLTINGEEFKLYTPHYEVKNFNVAGQNFDSITYKWNNSLKQNDDVDWYLIKIKLRADLNHTKDQTAVFLDPDQQEVQYILMLPDEVSTTWAKILVPWDLSLAPVSQYLTWTIARVGHYLQENDIVTYAMTEVPRKRYYAEIISLQNIWSDEAPVYYKHSPWSNQILWGQQIIADEEPPIPNASLIRRETQETISEWNALKWYVSTTYDLVIEWKDNLAVDSNAVLQSWTVIAANSWAITILSWLYYEQLISDTFTIAAVDVNWNAASDEVSLDIVIPNLTITNIEDVVWWKNIVTELDQDLDAGNIRFERNRFGLWEPIEWLTWWVLKELFPITVWQFVTTGGVFQEWDKIEFKDNAWNLLAQLDPDTWEIKIEANYQWTIDIAVDFDHAVPFIELIDKNTQTALFTTYLKPKTLTDINPIQLKNWSFSLVPLDQTFFWEFADWTCIQNSWWECEVYVSPNWVIYIPEPFNTSYSWTYQYNPAAKSITYKLKSIESNNVVDISFVIEAL